MLHEIIANEIERLPALVNRFTNLKRMEIAPGDGNFSLVFTAEDKLSRKKRAVAVKVFNPLEQDAYRRDSFEREGDMLRDLRGQRNIVPLVHEKSDLHLPINLNGQKGVLNARFYVTRLAISTVKNYILSGSKDYLRNILYFREMCKAVQRLQTRKICHRDIKPGNFLIYKKRLVCISDFGTARYAGAKVPTILPSYPAPPGDITYSAPEHLCLNFDDKILFHSDIYSLGAILFELFAKQPLCFSIYPNISELNRLVLVFSQVKPQDRVQVSDQFIDELSNNRVIPSVSKFDPEIPKTVSKEIDSLCGQMAALNYKKRLLDFQRIFLKLKVCEATIRYERSRKRK